MAAAHGGQVLVSLSTEELLSEAVGADVHLVDLGAHRLRDLSRPEQVFQLRVSGLASEFPPLRSLDAYPGNLPLQLTSFVGREQELNAIAKAFDATRLVTLTGVGGVGKTRLAMQVAAEVLPRFPDGAWFCELAAASDAEAMAQVVASTLGVNPRPGTTLDGSIIEFLAAKRLLVVLDNCEHLLGAVALLAEGVLRGCPGVRVLATSREGLGVDGERNWALRSLPIPDAADAGMAIEASEAVQLFVERALDAHTDFVVDASSLPAVGEICRRLDGIPLAIELAAARVVAMSPREIAARLDERFRLLTGGRRTAVERHQTLRATVDWSYSMLGAREQTVFDRLGVFAGSFDATAAEAIASGENIEPWDVLDGLTDLVAKSMVVTERTADGTRYQLLETMRAYARERLDDTADGDGWRRRHAEHYAGFAEQAGPGLASAEELVWRARLYEELDNIRAAVTWSLDCDDPGDNAYALRIIAALAYLANQDRPSGVGAWAERAVDLAEASATVQRGPVLAAAAESLRAAGDYEGARALAISSLRDGIDPEYFTLTLAYVVLSVVEITAGNVEEAMRVVSDGIAAIIAAGDDAFGRAALLSISSMWSVYVDPPLARTYADEAVRLSRRVGNPTALSIALFAFGNVIEEDEPDRALAAFDESIALALSGAAKPVLPAALIQSALILNRSGDPASAIRRLGDAVRESHANADFPMFAGSLEGAELILASCGEVEAAGVLAGIETIGSFPRVSIATIAQRLRFEENRAEIRNTLGPDVAAAAAARGAAMSYEQILENLLATIDRLAENNDD